MSTQTSSLAPLETTPWSVQEFESQLRAKGAGYHIHHPFNHRLNEGELQAFQVRGWVANRFYYQVCIPIKDAAIFSNCPDRSVRRQWIERLLGHDGRGDHQGANAGCIEAWLRLGEAVGLTGAQMWSHQYVVPGVRFAVQAYVNFARQASWQEAAISSFTELFAPKIHRDRLSRWPNLYPWIEPEGLAYFRSRMALAARDVEHGLQIAQHWCSTRERQQRALQILEFKLDILWSMLDSIERAYPDDLAVEARP